MVCDIADKSCLVIASYNDYKDQNVHNLLYKPSFVYQTDNT